MVERNLAPKDGQTANLGKADAKADKSHQAHIDIIAEVAQLVEHNLAKVGVADSSSVFRSQDPDLRLEWWNGRHEGLKIPWPTTAVRVQVPLRVHVSPICNRGTFYGLRIFSYGSGEAISPLKFPIELRSGGIFFAVTASVTWEGAAGRALGDGRAAGCRRIEWQGIDEGRAVIRRTEPAWMNVSL